MWQARIAPPRLFPAAALPAQDRGAKRPGPLPVRCFAPARRAPCGCAAGGGERPLPWAALASSQQECCRRPSKIGMRDKPEQCGADIDETLVARIIHKIAYA